MTNIATSTRSYAPALFADPAWRRKLGRLLLLSFVPGLNLIVWMGYSLSTAHNIVRGLTYPLPAWEDWPDIFARGLMSLVASLAYFAPALLLIAASAAAGQYLPNVGAVQLLLLVLAALWSFLAEMAITAGHIRYARTDFYSEYSAFGKRLADVRQNFAVLLRASIIQIALVLIISMLFLPLALTIIGVPLLLCAASVTNGMRIGGLARSMAQRR